MTYSQLGDNVESQRGQLRDLDSQLKEADCKLEKLEAKHKRQSQMLASGRWPVRYLASSTSDNEHDENSKGHEGQGRSLRQTGDQSSVDLAAYI